MLDFSENCSFNWASIIMPCAPWDINVAFLFSQLFQMTFCLHNFWLADIWRKLQQNCNKLPTFGDGVLHYPVKCIMITVVSWPRWCAR